MSENDPRDISDTMTADGAPSRDRPSNPQQQSTLPAGSSPLSADVLREREPGKGLPVVSLATYYELGREIATGGMGRIYAARDKRLDRPVAIKQLLVRSSVALHRFEREIRLSARLQHPAIVSVLEAGITPAGEPFYAMKLVAGRSLGAVIAERRSLEERLALLPNVIAAADALAYAHGQQIIHRDLKPANVLVGDFGETVVIDWGLAKDARSPVVVPADESERAPERPGDSDLTRTGAVLGTPAYMPPEQARGEDVDERADVYALGAVLYHVMGGSPPYGGSGDDVLSRVRTGSPDPVESLTR